MGIYHLPGWTIWRLCVWLMVVCMSLVSCGDKTSNGGDATTVTNRLYLPFYTFVEVNEATSRTITGLGVVDRQDNQRVMMIEDNQNATNTLKILGLFQTGDYNAEANQINNYQTTHVMYAKEGQLFTLNLQAEADLIPTPVSNEVAAIQLCNATRGNDYQDPSNSRLLYQTASDDNCDEGMVWAMVKLTALANQLPILLPNTIVSILDAIHAADSGRLLGWLVVERLNDTLAIKRYDVDFTESSAQIIQFQDENLLVTDFASTNRVTQISQGKLRLKVNNAYYLYDLASATIDDNAVYQSAGSIIESKIDSKFFYVLEKIESNYLIKAISLSNFSDVQTIMTESLEVSEAGLLEVKQLTLMDDNVIYIRHTGSKTEIKGASKVDGNASFETIPVVTINVDSIRMRAVGARLYLSFLRGKDGGITAVTRIAKEGACPSISGECKVIPDLYMMWNSTSLIFDIAKQALETDTYLFVDIKSAISTKNDAGSVINFHGGQIKTIRAGEVNIAVNVGQLDNSASSFEFYSTDDLSVAGLLSVPTTGGVQDMYYLNINEASSLTKITTQNNQKHEVRLF